jgi:hypothetical protein
MKWKRIFQRMNGIHEIEDAKDKLTESLERQCFSARKLSREAESVSRQRRERELFGLVGRARKYGAGD